MDPAHEMKVATAASGALDLWNLDLSDILANEKEPKEHNLSRRPASCNDLDWLDDSPDEEVEDGLLPRASSCRDLTKKESKSVRFHKVDTRVFERILDVNPSCAGDGPALGLGWNYNVKKSVHVEAYEKSKNFRRLTLSSPVRGIIRNKGTKKKHVATALSASKREKLARQFGFSTEEIQLNVAKIRKAQKQREKAMEELRNAELKEIVSPMRKSVGHTRTSAKPFTGRQVSASAWSEMSLSILTLEEYSTLVPATLVEYIGTSYLNIAHK